MSGHPILPSDPITLPLLPLRDVVAFPHTVTPLFVASAVWVRIAASGRSLAMHCSMAGVRAGWRRSSGKPWPSLCVWT